VGVFLLLALLVAALAPLLHPEPVSAASGVDDYPSRLKKAPQDSLVDPWQFYNRECTSWVAWRLNSENNVDFYNYWKGVHWGDASHWKAAAVAADVRVDDKPNRGAVAWWAAGSAGSSRGHVAWVQTVGDGAITIEEYNYLHRGAYDTRTISSSSSLWPSGFVHVKDSQLLNKEPPTVSGTPQVGEKLTTTRGTWSPKGTVSYQWFSGGGPLDGATDATYTPTADQLGRGLKVRVTLSAPGYKTMRVRSEKTEHVVPGHFKASTPPTVSGVPQVDQPLTASPGSWTPAGSLSYQWLVDGKPVHDATGTSYTPTPADLHKSVAIQVTVKQRGYDDAVATSVPTANVAPGNFLNSEPPTIEGTAQVGVPLTGHKGVWSPKATITYQWLVDDQVVPDADSRTFTPRPRDVGKRVVLMVTASRDGYLTSSVPSAATAETLPGVIENELAPVVSGRAVVGRTLRTTDGTWSISPDDVGYQWFSGKHKIGGATGSTYVVTGDEAGHRIHVVVTAEHQGYTSLSIRSNSTDRVVFGRVSFDKPTSRGHALGGRTLRARLGSVEPGTAQAHYIWYRDGEPIRGARSATYDVREADLGHRIRVVVTLEADHWVSRTRRSAATDAVRTRPSLQVSTSIRSGRVFVRVTVSAPGLTAPDGSVRVWRNSVRVGRFPVGDGHGSALLARMRHGKHELKVVFRGGPLETVARKTVTVTVP
jgi:surface antigen